MKNPFCYLNYGILAVVLSIGTSSCTSESKNVSATKSTVADSLVLTQVIQSDDPLTRLIDGNERFYKGKSIHQNQDTLTIKKLVAGQHPTVIIVSCSDSRVPPELVFDQGLGEIFSIRTAGNVIDNIELGSIEYAVDHLHTKLIVVLGHQGCGAIAAMLEHAHDKHVPGHVASIINALKNEPEEKVLLAMDNHEGLSEKAVRANVEHGVKQLRASGPILSELNKKNEIKIMGAIYNLETGRIEFLDI